MLENVCHRIVRVAEALRVQDNTSMAVGLNCSRNFVEWFWLQKLSCCSSVRHQIQSSRANGQLCLDMIGVRRLAVCEISCHNWNRDILNSNVNRGKGMWAVVTTGSSCTWQEIIGGTFILSFSPSLSTGFGLWSLCEKAMCPSFM